MGTVLSNVKDRKMTWNVLSPAGQNAEALQIKESEAGSRVISWGKRGSWLEPWNEGVQGKVDV